MLRDLEPYYSPLTGLSHTKEGACTPNVIHFYQYVSPQRLPIWCCIIWDKPQGSGDRVPRN
jgi:hypothetical protein